MSCLNLLHKVLCARTAGGITDFPAVFIQGFTEILIRIY